MDMPEVGDDGTANMSVKDRGRQKTCEAYTVL